LVVVRRDGYLAPVIPKTHTTARQLQENEAAQAAKIVGISGDGEIVTVLDLDDAGDSVDEGFSPAMKIKLGRRMVHLWDGYVEKAIAELLDQPAPQAPPAAPAAPEITPAPVQQPKVVPLAEMKSAEWRNAKI
jgi:hypothetical protein